MCSNDQQFANRIAKFCVKHFSQTLPRKGKPQDGKEWTLLAAVVMTKSNERLSSGKDTGDFSSRA